MRKDNAILREAETKPRSGRLKVLAPPAPTDKLRRLLWTLVQATLYRWSPVPLHAWRCALLRLFGASVGEGAHPYPDARIWAPWNLEMAPGSCLGPRAICYSVAPVRLGRDAVVSQGAHLCAATHDHRDPDFPLVAGPITVEPGAWVAAEAFVGPGVSVGARAVLGARAVATRDVEPGAVMAGNPAVRVGLRDAPPSLEPGRAS